MRAKARYTAAVPVATKAKAAQPRLLAPRLAEETKISRLCLETAGTQHQPCQSVIHKLTVLQSINCTDYTTYLR